MSRDEIIKKHLYSDMSPDNKNRCSESVDYLTNEEFEDSNYPLAKLQLMVKLKFRDSDNKLIRTDCVYAPAIYNQLVDNVNENIPFKSKIREYLKKSHIKSIMRKMRLIYKNIEEPVFIKPIHDTKIELTSDEENVYKVKMYDDIKNIYYEQAFVNIVLIRKFGSEIYNLMPVCSLPENINYNDTESTDITSATMILKIYTLFADGKLLSSYVPPYEVSDDIIKMNTKFNEDSNGEIIKWELHKKSELIKKFTIYATEVNNYHIY